MHTRITTRIMAIFPFFAQQPLHRTIRPGKDITRSVRAKEALTSPLMRSQALRDERGALWSQFLVVGGHTTMALRPVHGAQSAQDGPQRLNNQQKQKVVGKNLNLVLLTTLVCVDSLTSRERGRKVGTGTIPSSPRKYRYSVPGYPGSAVDLQHQNEAIVSSS